MTSRFEPDKIDKSELDARLAESARIRQAQEREIESMQPNTEAALQHLGIELPDGVDPLPEQTGCYVCDRVTAIEDATESLPMCVDHLGQTRAARVERYLRRTLDEGLHHAKPSDLSDDLRLWGCITGLYMFGPVGTGKSHAAAALVKRWYMHQIKLGLDPDVVWMNVPISILATLAEFSKGVAGKPGKLWDEATTAGLLVLDDIGVEAPKDWIRTRLYALIETRQQRRLTTIVTSNLNLGGLAERLESPQIASRLSQHCSLVSFEGKSDRRPGLGPPPLKG